MAIRVLRNAEDRFRSSEFLRPRITQAILASLAQLAVCRRLFAYELHEECSVALSV